MTLTPHAKALLDRLGIEPAGLPQQLLDIYDKLGRIMADAGRLEVPEDPECSPDSGQPRPMC